MITSFNSCLEYFVEDKKGRGVALKYVLNGLKQHDLSHKKIVKTLRYAKLLKALKVHTVGKSQFVSKLKKLQN